ncbi:MAG TPA: hypothetical protein VME42_10105 [Steroidobacteraceae bacterium]|nr:hypothetical protein [Steroidobacteraceae bacterium]
MEHRWGERFKVDWAVRIAARPYGHRAARLVDLSVSGACIKATFDLRLLSRVHVAITPPHRFAQPIPPVAAYVARKARDCIGLEWCELAPGPVVELLRVAALRRRAHRVARPAPRYQPAPPEPENLRQEGAEPEGILHTLP